ncbi:MAG: Gldg family protein [Rhodospirillales bacterium]
MNLFKDANRSKLMWAGLVLATIMLFSVNIFFNAVFKSARLDLTEEGLFTISEETRNVLGSLDEPIVARLYFSKILGERSPDHATYYARIRELLEQYSELSGGDIRLEIHHPEPFSDTEDFAVAFGLRGIPLSNAGDLGYFGLAATNSTDDQEVIPFFNTGREAFIEYDLTKMFHAMANPKKKVVGLISSLPIAGGGGPTYELSQPWAVHRQIYDFFDLRSLGLDADKIPDEIDTLMIVQPKGMTEEALYAVDQFVLAGGKALVFVDPYAEIETLYRPPMGKKGKADFNRLLDAWGVSLVKDTIAGDLDAARRVNTERESRTVITDYVVWLGLRRRNFDTGDVITGELGNLNLASSGILEKVEGSETEISPLLTTGVRAMKIDAVKVRLEPDIVSLFQSFRPLGKRLTLAARVKGPAKSVFPDGPPAKDKADKPESKTAETARQDHLPKSSHPINVIVVADADMLHDNFWVDIRDFFGQKILLPFANNADFVVNALDNLSGSDALIGLRGRGRSERPFYLVEDIRREAERRYRAKEKELRTKLKDIETKLDKIQRKDGKDGEAILSAEDKAALDEFRIEMVSIRKELRNVRHALRRDIERLGSRLKFINIAGMPLLLGLGLLIVIYRRRRRAVGGGAAA